MSEQLLKEWQMILMYNNDYVNSFDNAPQTTDNELELEKAIEQQKHAEYQVRYLAKLAMDAEEFLNGK